MNLKNLKSSFLSGLGVTLVTSVQAIVLAPILISSVGATMYGAWIMVSDVFVALQIFDFGITAYSAQRIAHARAEDNRRAASAHFFATITLIGMAVLALAALSVLFLPYIPLPYELTIEDKRIIQNCIAIGVISVSIQLLSYTLIAPSRALEQMAVINTFSLLGAVIGFLLTLVLLYFNHGLYAAAYGMLARVVANLVGGVLEISRLNSIIGVGKLDSLQYRSAIVEQAKNAPITFSGNLSSILIASSDSLLLARFSGLEVIAAYSVSKKIFDFARTIMDLFAYSSYGGLSAAFARLPADRRRVYLHHYLETAFYFALILIACSYASADVFVELWVGSKHYVGAGTVALIASGAMLSSISNITFSALRATGGFRVATAAIVMELVLKLLLAALLISMVGLSGMPLAIILSAAVGILIGLSQLEPHGLVSLLLRNPVLISLAVVAVLVAAVSYVVSNVAMAYLAKSLAVAISVALLRMVYLRLFANMHTK